MTTPRLSRVHAGTDTAVLEPSSSASRVVDRGRGLFRLEAGALELDVDASRGGRIVRFALDGQDVLTGPDVHPDNFGSTFWTSPQSAWGWPPPTEIDSDPYVVRSAGAALMLEGRASPALGLSVSKTFRVDTARQAMIIEYRIRNAGTRSVRAAPWEVTRVPIGGLTFYPTGKSSHCPAGIVPLRTNDIDGITWFRYDASLIATDQKWFADGARGWLAHLAGDLLFVKAFEDVRDGAQAPGEGEIEIFADGAHRYVELEQQGAYVDVDPGETVPWQVAWYLRRFSRADRGGAAREGDRDLVGVVERIVAP